MKCIKCQAEIDDDSIFCSECGVKQSKQSNSQSEEIYVENGYGVMGDVKYECPVCHSDAIQSFSMAWDSGVTTTNSSTFGFGYAGKFGVGSASTTSTHVSDLAAKVAPPVKKGIFGISLLGWILILFVGFCTMFNEITMVLYNVGILAFLGYRVYSNQIWNKNVYPGLIDEWEHGFICMRCGSKFRL